MIDTDRLEVHQNAVGAYKRKAAIRITSIVIAVLLIVLAGIYAATSIVMAGKSFPITVSGDGHLILAEDEDFTETSSRLQAMEIELTNISYMDLPASLDSVDKVGSHNGTDYLAYTFYIKNTYDKSVSVMEQIPIGEVVNRLDEAIRIRLYRNGISQTYAKMSADGTPEYGTNPFADDEYVINNKIDIEPGEDIRYTIVVWLEGDDPECIDDLRGGSVNLSMKFSEILPE